MVPIHISLEPFNTISGARETIRAASSLSSASYGVAGVRWYPAIKQRPTVSIELFSPELNGQISPGQCRFVIDLGVFRAPKMARWKWQGAPISVWAAPDLKLPELPEFSGVITDSTIDLDSGTLSVTATVDINFLNRPLLPDEFDGSGGLGGEADKRGTLKPAGFGAVENLPPVWFDTTNWIGMIDGYGNTLAITRLMEGLNDFGARVGDYATYAALEAAIVAGDVPPGRWATCVAQGLVGLGAPPVGPITVNATFGSDRIGAIASRILTIHCGLLAANIDDAAFTALDAAVDRPARYWTSEQRNVRELLEALAASVNATPLVTGQGVVSITRAITSAAIATLDRAGRTTPRVTHWQSAAPQTPVWRLSARTMRPASVIDYKDVNFVDDIIDVGLYDNAKTYRAGNIVWLSDNSSWLYINNVADYGHPPPAYAGPGTASGYWQNSTPPSLASDFTYDDGTPIENLKPAQAGADQTGSNVAAGFTGQSDWATFTGYTPDYLSLLSKPGANVLYNGSFRQKWQGWNPGSLVITKDWRGNIVQAPSGTGGEFTAVSTVPINAGPGEDVVISAVFSGTATNLGYMFVDIKWVNGGDGAILQYSSDVANGCLFRNTSGTRVLKSQAMVTPNPTDGSGFVKGYARIISDSDIAYVDGTRWVEQIKVESGDSPTPFSDEATDGANLANASGQIPDGRQLNSNNNFGLRSLSNPPTFSATAQTSSATINIGSDGVLYGDWGQSITLPSASFPGLANSTKYYFWRNMPTPDGAGSSYGYSSDLQNALGTGKVYLGYYTTPSSSGSGGTGGGGGGFYDNPDCVAETAFVPVAESEKSASEVTACDSLLVLETDTSTTRKQCRGNHIAEAECVRLITVSGIRLTLAFNTPMTLQDGNWAIAANASGMMVAVQDCDGFRWEPVKLVEPAGRRRVAHISVDQNTFAAGDEPGRWIFSHNPLAYK